MGRLRQIFRYKVFVDALFHVEVMSIFNLPNNKWYFTLHLIFKHSKVLCQINTTLLELFDIHDTTTGLFIIDIKQNGLLNE